MNLLSAIQKHVELMLKDGLSDKLSYHNVNHTLDVADKALKIAKSEGICDQQQLEDLHVAALYHDTGFLYVYKDHEKKSCELAREQLPEFGISAASIENICGMIRATRIPQNPLNKLEEIICDADLDYLGRSDFFKIAESLRNELMEFNFIKSNKEWNIKQVDFLSTHNYFTESSKKKRAPVKLKHINTILTQK